jgi:hypothetical protein
MDKDDSFRRRPGIGVIVDFIKDFEIGREIEIRHLLFPCCADRSGRFYIESRPQLPFAPFDGATLQQPTDTPHAHIIARSTCRSTETYQCCIDTEQRYQSDDNH